MRLRDLGIGGGCLAALALAGAYAAPALTTGCTTHQCDSDFVNIDQSTGMTIGDLQVLPGGEAIWESSPIDGTWIDYPGQRTYFFGLPQGFVPRQPPVAYVATGPTPDQPDASSTYVQASGQLAELGSFVNGGFLITNATCAEYWLYVSVAGTYAPPPAPDDAGAGD